MSVTATARLYIALHSIYTPGMAMGRRKDRARTPGLWIATNELPPTGGHPFYQRLNQVLDAHAFDEFVEAQCAPFYANTVGRPSLTPGTYFRLLLIGYFEGIDSERGIAWRTADSLALRGFLGLGLDEVPPVGLELPILALIPGLGNVAWRRYIHIRRPYRRSTSMPKEL
jgi:Transposase domain (DUF772)